MLWLTEPTHTLVGVRHSLRFDSQALRFARLAQIRFHRAFQISNSIARLRVSGALEFNVLSKDPPRRCRLCIERTFQRVKLIEFAPHAQKILDETLEFANRRRVCFHRPERASQRLHHVLPHLPLAHFKNLSRGLVIRDVPSLGFHSSSFVRDDFHESARRVPRARRRVPRLRLRHRVAPEHAHDHAHERSTRLDDILRLATVLASQHASRQPHARRVVRRRVAPRRCPQRFVPSRALGVDIHDVVQPARGAQERR